MDQEQLIEVDLMANPSRNAQVIQPLRVVAHTVHGISSSPLSLLLQGYPQIPLLATSGLEHLRGACPEVSKESQ